MPSLSAEPAVHLAATLKWLHPGGDEVFEIRILNPALASSPHWQGRAFGASGKKIVAGWFRDQDKAAALVGQIKAEGIYVTLNPCKEAILARVHERLKANTNTSSDGDIASRRNLLFDFDPKRPAGISSTDNEHGAAILFAQQVKAELAAEGWPAPLVGDSGNGAHLVYALELEHTQESTALLKAVLGALAHRYAGRLQDCGLEVDQTVFNASRISKLYGTRTGKGDNLPERPHRRAQILSLPAERVPVARELLERLAAESPPAASPRPSPTRGEGARGVQAGKPAPPGSLGMMDVEAYLAHYGKEVVKVKELPHGGRLYCLDECVFDETHSGNEASIGQGPDGALFYQCFHNSCKGRLWVEARRLISGEEKLGEFFPGGVRGGRDARPTGKRGAQAGKPAPPGPPPPEEGLPTIIITHRFLQDKSDEGLAALVQGNDPPGIFVRSGSLARVLQDEKYSPRIDTLSDMALRGLLCRRALFFKQTTQGCVPASPPMEIPRDIMALGSWPFPPLEGVSAIPIFRPDGSVCVEPGYDPATRLYYVGDPDLEDMPEVLDAPEPDEIEMYRDMLLEIFCDIPFAAAADRANALALFCTLPLRPAIAGLLPMAVITAPTPGTGKSLLADVVALLGTGKVAPMEGLASTDDETRKLITSLLEKAAPLVCFDNVEGDVKAPSLARALTCTVWEDRILGQSVTVSLPQRALWICTGNNVHLRGDLPRRTFPIRLDAQMSKPWERQKFKHPQLKDYVRQYWPDYLTAVFTLARAWIKAGRPAPEKRLPVLGSYEGWVETLGGFLAFAGVAGFLENLDDFQAAADQEGQEWEAFLTTWRSVIGNNACACQEVKELLEEHNAFAATLPGYLGDVLKNPERDFARSLGKALAKKENRPYGDQNLAVQRAGEVHRILRWRVAPLGQGEEVASPVSGAPVPKDVGLGL